MNQKQKTILSRINTYLINLQKILKLSLSSNQRNANGNNKTLSFKPIKLAKTKRKASILARVKEALSNTACGIVN